MLGGTSAGRAHIGRRPGAVFSAREMWESALQLAEDISRQISETNVVERGKLLAGMVALFVEIAASG